MRHTLLATIVVLFFQQWCNAQDGRAAKAPPNHSLLKHAWGGSYFIPNALYKEYDEIQKRVESLQQTIDQDNSDSHEVFQSLETLRVQLTEIRSRIEKEQVYVSPVQVFEQTDTYNFELAEMNRVVILADQIRIESWEGQGIQCMLKKHILAEARPAEAEFEKIFVQHEISVPKNYIGETETERKARSNAYYASPDGQKLSSEERAIRDSVIQEIANQYSRYQSFQGQPAHLLQIKGLDTGERKWVSIDVGSEGGTSSSGGTWDRRAELTVQLPRHAQTAVLGCGVGVHVVKYDGGLILSSHRSNEFEYNGEFLVEDMKGNLASYGVPFTSISNVDGSVQLDSTGEHRNGGQHHSHGLRRMYVDLAGTTSIREVTGDLTAKYLHTRLNVAKVHGIINIENQFGPTALEVSEQINLTAPHRVVSESGPIRIYTPRRLLSGMEWFLCTTLGDLRVNVEREFLEDSRFTHGGRSWIAMFTPTKEEQRSSFAFRHFERPRSIMNNAKRSPGFDVLSQAGRILLDVREPAQP